MAPISPNDQNDGKFDATQLLKQLRQLIDDELYESAQILAYQYNGDAFKGLHEYKRAIHYYSICLSLKEHQGNLSSHADDTQIKYKAAFCMFKVQENQSAITLLQSIPLASRNATIHILLGKVYQSQGLNKKAEESFIAALRLNPYALEACQALADLTLELKENNSSNTSTNQSKSEIEFFYQKLALSKSNSKVMLKQDANWVHFYLNAQIQEKKGNYHQALESLDVLERIFPMSLLILLLKAKIQLQTFNLSTAIATFNKARQVDPSNVKYMDLFAKALKDAGAAIQLYCLVRDLFEINANAPETWLAAAIHSDLKADKEGALQLCDRAIACNRNYARGYLLKGQLLLALDRPEHASVAFTTCCKMQKSIEAFEGLIESFYEITLKGFDKYNEALHTARLAMLYMPNNPRPLIQLGTVLALKGENKDRARKAFNKALSFDPNNVKATFGLVDLYITEGHYKVAIEKLEHLSLKHTVDVLFAKLADVYALNKQYEEALPNYHKALSLNASCHRARRGLERLEKLMRGEDPDMNATMDDVEPEEDMDDTMQSSNSYVGTI